jgi:hypothetical protein
VENKSGSIVQHVNKTLKKTKEQFRETGNIGYTRHRTKTNKTQETQKSCEWTHVLDIVSVICLDVLSSKCYGVRYDFRIPAIFVLSLPLVVCWRAHVIFKSLCLHVTTIALQMSKINQDQSYNTLRKPRDNLGKLVTLGTQDTGRRQTKHKNHVGGRSSFCLYL